MVNTTNNIVLWYIFRQNLYITLGLCNLRRAYIFLWQECFHEKDYLNYRYHAKRCLYLCVIKKHLKFSPLVQKVEWSTFQNEARKPILVVYPGQWLGRAAWCIILRWLMVSWLIIYIVNWKKVFLWYCSFKAFRNSRVFDKTNSIGEVPSQCPKVEFGEEQCSWGKSW